MGILHQPHPINDKIKRVSRLVILPDYQGIGLGTKFLDIVAKHYIKQGYDFSIITSAKNLIKSLKSKKEWCLSRYSIKAVCTSKTAKIDCNRKLRDCYNASFFYKRNKNE
jgi:GNAT superfamily N-acetyltransferase